MILIILFNFQGLIIAIKIAADHHRYLPIRMIIIIEIELMFHKVEIYHCYPIRMIIIIAVELTLRKLGANIVKTCETMFQGNGHTELFLLAILEGYISNDL